MQVFMTIVLYKHYGSMLAFQFNRHQMSTPACAKNRLSDMDWNTSVQNH